MSDWKNININTNLIKAKTEKAILFKMPHNSEYDGYMFWHTSKLIRHGKNSAYVSAKYTDKFTFTLKKYGKGRYNNRDVIDEIVIDAQEFKNAFNVINENARQKQFKNPYETYKPQTVEAVDNNLLKELQDDEQDKKDSHNYNLERKQSDNSL